jgi:hypothetical protein
MPTNEIGLGAYPSRAQTAPRKVLDAYLKKSALRAELAKVSAELDAGVQALNASELEDLKAMMVQEVEAADEDALALRQQVEQEAALAETVKPLSVPVSRKAAHALATEARRRLSRGIFPSSGALVSEAVCAAYGSDA